MSDAGAQLTELIEDAERIRGRLILLNHAATTGDTLCELGIIALSEFGIDCINFQSDFVRKLENYKAELTAS